MRFNGDNLEAVVEAHTRWIDSGGENDEDRADFSGADLKNCFMAGVSLYGANFRGADLSGADLFRSDLRKADLTGAKLFEANLYRTQLRGAIGLPYIPQNVPDTGSFIAWKRAKTIVEGTHYDHSVIVKLRIPDEAKRICLWNGEYRASKAEVLEIQTIDGDVLRDTVAYSIRDGRTVYKVGETLSIDNFDSDIYSEHAPGIFFYLDRKRAVQYLTEGDDADGNPIPVNSAEIIEQCKDTGMGGTPPNILDYLIDDDLRELAFALKYLPEDQRAVVVLKYCDRYTPEMIARTLKVTLEEAENIRTRAEEDLAAICTKSGGGG